MTLVVDRTLDTKELCCHFLIGLLAFTNTHIHTAEVTTFHSFFKHLNSSSKNGFLENLKLIPVQMIKKMRVCVWGGGGAISEI